MRSRNISLTPLRPRALNASRTSEGLSFTPVMASRYWQNTTARDRNEITRIATRTPAKTRVIQPATLFSAKRSLMGGGNDTAAPARPALGSGLLALGRLVASATQEPRAKSPEPVATAPNVYSRKEGE